MIVISVISARQHHQGGGSLGLLGLSVLIWFGSIGRPSQGDIPPWLSIERLHVASPGIVFSFITTFRSDSGSKQLLISDPEILINHLAQQICKSRRLHFASLWQVKTSPKGGVPVFRAKGFPWKIITSVWIFSLRVCEYFPWEFVNIFLERLWMFCEECDERSKDKPTNYRD